MTSPSTPELQALQAAVVGRYSIERELGRGGMGIVFLALDTTLDRQVAIKLLPPLLATDERMRARFVREARTSARLSHPNIVPIHSVEEHADVVFFVMGYVDGETLTARVRRAGPLAARDGSRIIQELAWALAYAHSTGVIHRDVKPDNVMIDRASGRAMLTDFGIARVNDRNVTTGSNEIVGTPQYMSPEQASGAVIDGRSDLYSLGVTAFFALTGGLPFQSSTVMGWLGKHLTQPPPPIAAVRESLPAKLSVAVDRCLAKDPSNRFANGEELADAIADARGADVQIAPAVREFLRDRTRISAEIGVLISAIFVLGAFTHLSFVTLAGPLALLATTCGFRLHVSAGNLLKAGYGFNDVRAALEAEGVQRREELGLSETDEPWLQRAERYRVAGSSAIAVGFLSADALLKLGGPALGLVSLAVGAVGAALMVRAERYFPRQKRWHWADRWFDRRWQGRFGQWFFSFAEESKAVTFARVKSWFGGRRAPAATPFPSALNAHTEVILARAAEEMLDALPSAARALLPGGHAVIDRLRAQIAALRRHEEQLEASLAQAGESHTMSASPDLSNTTRTLIERRVELTNDLEQARRAAADRRASAVAALENIRLQLLRLRTGLGSPADLTADLDAAMEIERQISAAIEVNRIVS
ncbi:MAG: serine/threonine-protein kinase [bacterium]